MGEPIPKAPESGAKGTLESEVGACLSGNQRGEASSLQQPAHRESDWSAEGPRV